MGALIVLGLWVMFIVATPVLARSKGRSGLIWFLLALPLGLLALIMVALMPAVPEASNSDSTTPSLGVSLPRAGSESVGYRLGKAWRNSTRGVKAVLGIILVGILALVLYPADQDKLRTASAPNVPPPSSVEAIHVEQKSEQDMLKDVAEQKKRAATVERERIVQAKVEAKRKRSEGVVIGMNKEDVLASKWGKPESVNKTTTAYGTREQWVYGGHNYLYFNNDTLTTIQN
jgi:hypothetical protein